MKNVALRYGVYSGLTMMVIFLLSWTLLGHDNYRVQEVIGYAGIILGLLFVFIGIRRYRDSVNGGKISFLQGLKIGLLIILIPALMVGILDILYVGVFDPEFMDKYYEYMVDETKKQKSGQELEEAVKTLESQREMFSSPLVLGVVMFFTVFFIGVIVVVISSLMLQRR